MINEAPHPDLPVWCCSHMWEWYVQRDARAFDLGQAQAVIDGTARYATYVEEAAHNLTTDFGENVVTCDRCAHRAAGGGVVPMVHRKVPWMETLLTRQEMKEV